MRRVFSGRAVLPSGEARCDVVVREGRIAAVGAAGALAAGSADVVMLADDEVLLPGLVDTHVHINEPGRAEWEGFACATRAAAAGGVTTLVDMPLNALPPTLDVAALEVKRSAAAGQCFVDVGFWGGVVPGNLDDLAALHESGVFGFKAFLLDSGVEEFPPLSPADLQDAMTAIAELGSLLVVHAEDPTLVTAAPHGPSYADFLASRPPASEDSAVRDLATLARTTSCRVHVVHVSSAGVLPELAASATAGRSAAEWPASAAVSAETCPHYLTLAAEDIADGATLYKCCPPIRDRANRDALWGGLRDGTLSCVVSDHSPATADLKATGDFATAWGGIASLQIGLPLTWTEARTRGFALADVVRWMSAGPAELVGLRRKGAIAVGYDADLCVFAPDDTWTIDATRLHHRHPTTPYDGHRVTGVVRHTWLRGEPVGDDPRGSLLARDRS